MAQKTFVDGDVLTASDINTYLMGEGGAWTSHTPQIDQGATTNIAKTVTYSKYARYGRTIIWNFRLELTAGGTAGTVVSLTLPATAAASEGISGAGRIHDVSATDIYVTTLGGLSTTTLQFISDRPGSLAGWGQAPSIALASGDLLIGTVTYEAAS